MTASSSASNRGSEKKDPETSRPEAYCILGESKLALWGLTAKARLERGLAGLGVTDEILPEELGRWEGSAILARADGVIDTPLLSVLAATPGLVLTGTDGSEAKRLAVHAPPGTANTARRLLIEARSIAKSPDFFEAAPKELDIAYWNKLRKRETPYAMAVDESMAAHAEWRMFMGTYKGATDFVTKHIWPRPAFYITRFIAPMGVSPNMVTALSAVFVVLACFLFAAGAWGPGLAAAWMMALLDTVDGKLARVTLSSSRWGDIFDHGIDLIHPPFWYVAWGLGLAPSGMALGADLFWWTLFAILAGYVAQRALEGIAIKFYRLEIHIWRPIDTFFRQVTARRNPNMAILTVSALAGRPDFGLVAIAVWTVICLILHSVQIFQALHAYRTQGTLSSWLAGPGDGA